MPKRYFKLLLSLALVLSLLAFSAAADDYRAEGIVTASALRLRQQASTDSKILATADKGAKVTLHNEEPFSSDGGLWYMVTFAGIEGYMSAEYIDICEAGTEEVSETSIGYGTVTGSAVNVRKAPNTDCAVLKILSKGTVVEVTGSMDGWYSVRHNGTEGYMSAEYISYSAERPVALAPPVTYSSSVEAMAAYGSGYGGKATNTATDRLVAAAALDGANPSAKQREIVETAMSYLGSPYVYGASNGKSFDCGGFTSWVYRECGLPINRTAVEQYKNNGTKVASKDDLRPGDLILFKDPSVSSNIVTHVGMYVGQGKFIHSGSGNSGAGRCVKINDLTTGYYARVYYSAKHIVD